MRAKALGQHRVSDVGASVAEREKGVALWRWEGEVRSHHHGALEAWSEGWQVGAISNGVGGGHWRVLGKKVICSSDWECLP